LQVVVALLAFGDVGNRFNSWVLRTRLGVVEELMGDDKRGLANHMKALITQEIASGAARRVSGRHVLFLGGRHSDADSELRIAGADRRPDGRL
jgi:hypothetical protein